MARTRLYEPLQVCPFSILSPQTLQHQHTPAPSLLPSAHSTRACFSGISSLLGPGGLVDVRLKCRSGLVFAPTACENRRHPPCQPSAGRHTTPCSEPRTGACATPGNVRRQPTARREAWGLQDRHAGWAEATLRFVSCDGAGVFCCGRPSMAFCQTGESL